MFGITITSQSFLCRIQTERERFNKRSSRAGYGVSATETDENAPQEKDRGQCGQ